MKGEQHSKTNLALSAALFVFFSTAAFAADTAQTARQNANGSPAAKPAATPATKPTLQKSANANSKGKITEKRALDLVMAMPEVKEFFKEVTKSKIAKPTIDLDRKEGSAYVVHVYEVVNDGPESSHTATKNWYYININTGKITKEF